MGFISIGKLVWKVNSESGEIETTFRNWVRRILAETSDNISNRHKFSHKALTNRIRWSALNCICPKYENSHFETPFFCSWCVLCHLWLHGSHRAKNYLMIYLSSLKVDVIQSRMDHIKHSSTINIEIMVIQDK